MITSQNISSTATLPVRFFSSTDYSIRFIDLYLRGDIIFNLVKPKPYQADAIYLQLILTSFFSFWIFCCVNLCMKNYQPLSYNSWLIKPVNCWPINRLYDFIVSFRLLTNNLATCTCFSTFLHQKFTWTRSRTFCLWK